MMNTFLRPRCSLIPLIIVICCLFHTSFSNANNSTDSTAKIHVNNDPNETFFILPHAQFFKEAESDTPLTIDQAAQSTRYQSLIGNIQFSQPAGTYWFRFSVSNQSKQPQHYWLDIDNMRLNQIDLYTKTDNGFTQQESGSSRPNPNWTFQERLNLVRLNLQPGETNEYYLRIENTKIVRFSAKLYNDHSHIINFGNLNVQLGIIFGVLISLFFYTTNIYISLKDRTFLYFIGLLCSVTIQISGNQGIFKLLHLGNATFIDASYALGSGLWLLFSAFFIRNYLNLPKHHPYLDKFILIITIIPIVLLMTHPWSNNIFDELTMSLGIVSVCSILLASTLRLKDGYTPAIFPFAANLGWLVLMSLLMSLPEEFIAKISLNNIINILITLKLLLLACGLNSRIGDLNRKLSIEINQRKNRENQLTLAQKISRHGDWSWNPETNVFEFSDNTYEILPNLSRSNEFRLEEFLKTAKEKDRNLIIQAFKKAAHTKQGFHHEFSLIHKNGACRHYHLQADFNINKREKYSQKMVGTIHDITEKKLAELSHQESEQRWRDLADSTFEAILIFKNSKVIDANQACESLAGYSQKEIIGTNAEAIFGEENLALLQQEIAKDSIKSFELTITNKAGKEVFIEVRSRSGVFSGNPVFVVAIRDISERKNYEQELRQLGHYDNLTGLANRTLFQERLQTAINKSQRSNQKHALLFIDLDQFKNVNDSLGHETGDQLLIEVGKRIKDRIRKIDTAARFGGDEFAILIEDVSAPYSAAKVADDLLKAMAEHIQIDDYTLLVTPSIGIAMYPFDGDNQSELLRKADTAMYHAKDQGRNNYQFYTEQLNDRIMRRMDLESELRLAIERDEFFLHFQPKVNITTGDVVGAEALLRWESRKHGLVSPAEFVGIAEETGLILPIGELVLEQACTQAAHWIQEFPTFTSIAVNISGIQFKHINLVDSVAKVLEETKLSPENLELEITENAIIDNAEEAIRIMGELKELGVKLSLDDFGTGYSSLNYLKRFPVDCLKIDRSFVAEIVSDKTDLKIADSIVKLAHDLNLYVVAEGVETIEQLNIMKEMGCDQLQGFLFSRPLSNNDLIDMLKSKNNLYNPPLAPKTTPKND